MPQQSAATVIDLDQYRRKHRPEKSEAKTRLPVVMWVPTAWGYWVPVWSMR